MSIFFSYRILNTVGKRTRNKYQFLTLDPAFDIEAEMDAVGGVASDSGGFDISHVYEPSTSTSGIVFSYHMLNLKVFCGVFSFFYK